MPFLHYVCQMKHKYSPTYTCIIDLLFLVKSNKFNVYTSTFDKGRFTREDTGKQSTVYQQDFYMSASEVFSMINAPKDTDKKKTQRAIHAENMRTWYLFGLIASELKIYNALWQCDPALKATSPQRASLAHLVKLDILIPTETTHIYLVNPRFMRRGEFFTVLNTTASILRDAPKVLVEHIRDKKPVKALDVAFDHEEDWADKVKNRPQLPPDEHWLDKPV